MRLTRLVGPLAIGTVVAGLIYAPAIVRLPPWADGLRVELVAAAVLAAVVGAVSGSGNVRTFFGTIALVAALAVQASLSLWACGTPIIEYGYGITIIIGPWVFGMFPWLAVVTLLVAAAAAYAVLQRFSPAYRALAAAVVLIAMTGTVSALTAGPPPPASQHCLDF